MKKYNKNFLEALLQRILRLYDTLNEAREEQLIGIKTVKDHIYKVNRDFKHGSFELPDIYEQAQTLKAHVLESLSSHPEGLFEVFPSDLKFSENAKKQKTMLVSVLENMKMSDNIEKIVDSLIETGEAIVFVGWKKIYKNLRKAVETDGEISFMPENKLVYDGPILRTLSPVNFVFDTNSNFENAAKIYRFKASLAEVLEDKNNALIDNETILELKNLAAAKNEDCQKLEIIEYWGDIQDENNNIIKNQLVVIAEKRFIIRFEDNPYLNCPFIYGNLIENPETKRGISPLLAAVCLTDAANCILNTQLKAYSLIVNPPYLAPKGAFKGEQDVKPGTIIEYDSVLLPQMPTPLNFSQALCGWDFLNYFKGSIESTTGVYKTMKGNLNVQNRTATEIDMASLGQNARLNMILDVINRKIIVPVIQKTADIICNFKLGTENLLARVSGELKMVEITDEVRFGDYVYRYTDQKGAQERKFRQREMVKAIGELAKVPELSSKINWEECFRLILGQFGVENVQTYLKQGVFTGSNPEKGEG